MNGVSITGLVLAAGAGSRMGTPKGELVVDGQRLVDRATQALADGGCERVLCVVRPGVRAAGAHVVVNPEPERGLRSSLELGMNAAPGGAAVLVLLADMPGIGAGTVAATIAGWHPGRIAIARYPSSAGHPILMAAELWREALVVAAPDEGARRYLASHPELVNEVRVDDDPTDLDTPADLRRWTSRS